MRVNPNVYDICPALLLAGIAANNGMRMLANEIVQASPTAKRQIEFFANIDGSLRGMLRIHVAGVIVDRMNAAP